MKFWKCYIKLSDDGRNLVDIIKNKVIPMFDYITHDGTKDEFIYNHNTLTRNLIFLDCYVSSVIEEFETKYKCSLSRDETYELIHIFTKTVIEESNRCMSRRSHQYSENEQYL